MLFGLACYSQNVLITKIKNPLSVFQSLESTRRMMHMCEEVCMIIIITVHTFILLHTF